MEPGYNYKYGLVFSIKCNTDEWVIRIKEEKRVDSVIPPVFEFESTKNEGRRYVYLDKRETEDDIHESSYCNAIIEKNPESYRISINTYKRNSLSFDLDHYYALKANHYVRDRVIYVPLEKCSDYIEYNEEDDEDEEDCANYELTFSMKCDTEEWVVNIEKEKRGDSVIPPVFEFEATYGDCRWYVYLDRKKPRDDTKKLSRGVPASLEKNPESYKICISCYKKESFSFDLDRYRILEANHHLRKSYAYPCM
jgi:hypothetical protein